MTTLLHHSARYATLSTCLFLLLLLAADASLTQSSAEQGAWRQYADPEQAGWSRQGLGIARDLAIELGSGAVVVIDRGNVVVAWGDVRRPFKMASVRKSLISALYGFTWRAAPSTSTEHWRRLASTTSKG